MSTNIRTPTAGARLQTVAGASFDSNDGPWTVSGVALGDDNILHTPDGEPVLFSSDVLAESASTMVGEPVTVDHPKDDNGEPAYPPPTDETVGKVTDAKHVPGKGVVFSASVHDPGIARGIDGQSYDVSVHPTFRTDGTDEETGAEKASAVDFLDLSVVSLGDSPDNYARIGPSKDVAAWLHAGGVGEVFAAAAQVHDPSYSSTTEGEWSKPSMSDFDTDDLSEIAGHFLVSFDGFPPENFGDLSLPVVSVSGALNRNALANAKSRASQVDGLSGDALSRVETKIDNLAEKEFDADFGESESESTASLWRRLGQRVGVATAATEQPSDESAESGTDTDTSDLSTMTEEDEETADVEEQTSGESAATKDEQPPAENVVEVDLGEHESLEEMIDSRVSQQVEASREQADKQQKVDEIIAYDEDYDEDDREDLLAAPSSVIEKNHKKATTTSAAPAPGVGGGRSEARAALGGDDDDLDEFGTGVSE